MDERAVFERFHEALELEPRAGAYERFRATFVTPPAAAKKQRPAFRMRFSRMTLRVAAAASVVAIAIALVAGYLASHHPTAGVPANHVDQNTRAYQMMMKGDDAALTATFSTHCATVSDTGCIAALGRITPKLQKWIADIDAFTVPQQFVVINVQARKHASAALTDLSLAADAVRAQDNPGLVNAINAGGSNANWLGRAASAISEWQEVKASDYVALVKTDGQELSVCAGCQAMSAPDFTSCAGSQLDACLSNILPVDDLIGQVETDVIISAAPAALASKDQRLQVDLAAADSALTTMLSALLTHNAPTVSATVASYRSALAAVGADITAITG